MKLIRTSRWLGAILGGLMAGVFGYVPLGFGQVASDQNGLEEVVVTSQRRSEKIQSVPIMISAINGNTLQDYGVYSSNDLAKVAANININLPQGEGNQPAISIRGIGLNDFNSNNAGSAGIYVDEFYLSSPTSQGFGLYDLERVEILKGPQGTLYGRNASSGAINFITRKPTDTLDGYVLADVGNFNSARLEAAVGGPIAPGVDGRVAFVRNYSEGYFHNLGTGRWQNGANDINFRGQLLFKPSDVVRILVSGSYSHVDRLPDAYRHLAALVAGTQGDAVPVPCPVQDTLAGTGNCVDLYGAGNAPGPWENYGRRTQHLKVTDYGGTVRVDWTPGDFDFVSLTGYHYNQRYEPEDTQAGPNNLLTVDYYNNNNEFTQELRIGQTRPAYNWVAGLYYLHENLHQDQPLWLFLDGDLFPEFGIPAGPGAADGIANYQQTRNKQVTDAFAVFGQAEWKLSNTLSAVVGARVTRDDKTFHNFSEVQYQLGGRGNFGPENLIIDTDKSLSNSAFNYRLGLNYTPVKDVLVYGSIATGFKSSDFNGSFLATDPALAAAQSSPVPPEKVTTYEIGAKTDLLGRRLRFNVALFYNDYRQMQIFAQINAPVNGMYEVINTLASADKARSYGADIEIAARPTENLLMSAEIGLLNSKLTKFGGPNASIWEGHRLVFAPDTSAFLMAEYRIPLGNNAIRAQVNASYKSEQNLDSTGDPYQIQPAYWLLGARLSYEIGKTMEFAAYGTNLANKYYATTTFDAVNPFGFDEQVVGKPRMYGLEVRYRF